MGQYKYSILYPPSKCWRFYPENTSSPVPRHLQRPIESHFHVSLISYPQSKG